MLPFMKKDKPVQADSQVSTKPVPHCNASYDSENNLVYIDAAFDPRYLQNVLPPLEEATGCGRIAPISSKKRSACQADHAHSIPPQHSKKEFDVFISYAGADIKYVTQLVTHMRRRQINVWFDKTEIHCGDSHRLKIDQGLSRSRYTMVVLSPSYIQEERYWTRAEMNAAIQNESIRQTQLIPVLYHLSPQEIQAYSPILASRSMIDAAKHNPSQIAKKVRELLDRNLVS